MIVRMGLLHKRADLSPAEFRRYWRTSHADAARGLRGLQRYEQNHVVEAAQRGIDYARGPLEYDGISQLWFRDLAAMEAAFEPRAAEALTGDEARFMDGVHIVAAARTAVIEPPSGAPLLKRMSLLTRTPGTSAADFEASWREHADLVRTMPGVAGYVQNVVVGRSLERDGKSGRLDAEYADLPIDGIVELWFADEQALQRAFDSPQGQRTMAHARTFLDHITTYLVESYRIV